MATIWRPNSGQALGLPEPFDSLVWKSIIFFDSRVSFSCTYSVMCNMGTERTSRSAYGRVKRPRHGNFGVDTA